MCVSVCVSVWVCVCVFHMDAVVASSAAGYSDSSDQLAVWISTREHLQDSDVRFMNGNGRWSHTKQFRSQSIA